MKHVHAFGDDCLGDLDAVGLARSIASGDVSPLEAATAALDRIDRVEPQLAAVAVDDRDLALKRAAADEFTGAFAGVPSLIKNNTDFAGLPTLHGSAAVAPTPAREHEAVTRELVGTGLNILGASTMPAFGLTATTEFVDRPPTRNPWDTDFSCGASSGGAAALVAAGAVPIAHANDGGGSIRIPAASCGLVGLKPSRGRVAQAKQMRGLPIDLISNGVVTRSVRDTAHYLADVERQRPGGSLPPVGLVDGPGQERSRIALINAPLTGRLLDADTDRELSATVEVLESLGHRVETIPMPVDRSYIDQFTDYWALLAFGVDRMGRRSVGKGFDRSRLDPFTKGLSSSFLRHFYRLPGSILGLRRATARFRSVFDHYDLILSPTLAHAVPEIGYLAPDGDFDEVFARLIDYVAFTPANNSSGTPAITLPLGRDENGLPLGMHLSADLGGERRLLELAFELEGARPFARIQD
ncbi:amidase [Gordonia neofelifaecis]|uniref:amidase n=1 Tax=Gordonia neofelifaecis NRRL B-59395 TaxID=644548 RepID=F1YNC0_9ACTN|nr:amidase [Gordonia neofelifaecis]EGD53831.1 amidase [Gordonia neofelifaecis NRRL B-59395]